MLDSCDLVGRLRKTVQVKRATPKLAMEVQGASSHVFLVAFTIKRSDYQGSGSVIGVVPCV